MLIRGKQFLLAKSTIFVTRNDWLDCIVKDGVPLGEIWRLKGIMPNFKLHAVGRGETYFWRSYQLSSSGMMCGGLPHLHPNSVS